MLAILIGGCLRLRLCQHALDSRNQASLGTLLATFALLLLAAANEELVFRGFPLQILVEGGWGMAGDSALSLLFGAMHLSNPNVSFWRREYGRGWYPALFARMCGPDRSGCHTQFMSVGMSAWALYSVFSCRASISLRSGRQELPAAKLFLEAVTVRRADC